MQTLIDFGVPAIAFALLTGVGLNLTAEDFTRVRRQPAVVLTGLFAPLFLLPPFAIALAAVVPAGADAHAGLLIVAVCPVGGISNVFSYLARASPALSVTLTGLSSLLAGMTIPAVSAILERALDRPLGLSVPVAVLFSQAAVMLAVPVTLGSWVRRRWPAWAIRYRADIERAAFLGVALLIVFIVADDPGAFLGGLGSTAPLAVLFIAGAFAIGWLTSPLVTRDVRDRFTLATEFGTRNVGVAMAIAVTVLGRVEFARFGATYFLTEIPLMLLAVAAFRLRFTTKRTKGTKTPGVSPQGPS